MHAVQHSSSGWARSVALVIGTFVVSVSGAFANAPRTPIDVEITIPESLPGIGETFGVEATVSSALDAPGTVLQLQATPGVGLLGRTNFRLDLLAGESRTFTVEAVIEALGDHTIRARARRVVDREREIWGDLAAAHFNATDLGTALGHGSARDGGVEIGEPSDGDPPFIVIPPERGLRVSPDAAPPLALPPPTSADDDVAIDPNGSSAGLLAAITITIRLRGRDPNDTAIDIGQMLGEILNAATDDHIAYFSTDSLGEGTVTFTNPGAAGFYVRWWSYMNWDTGVGDDNILVVRPSVTDSWADAHKVWTNGFVRADGVHDLGTFAIASGENRRGAFSLLNDINDAWLYIWFNGGNLSPEGVHVEWESDSLHGTHYHPGGEAHLEGDDWGTAANLPPSDTVVHEYGHAIMYNVYGDSIPANDCPSPHFIQQTGGINCAWIEGWADFLVMPVNGGTSYDWPSGSTLDLESPTWGTPGWDDDDMVEGRVAGSLLDIFDAANEGRDDISMGFNEIWDTLYSQNDDTFLQFFTGWRNLGYGDCLVDAAIYQNTIDYDSAPSIAGLPDVHCDEDTTCNNVIDLFAFASDVECGDVALTFAITGNTNPNAGVTIDSDRFIDVNSQPNFVGSSTITVRVTDAAGKTDTDSFIVTIDNVNDPPGAPAAPSGPSIGVATVSYEFTASADDIDGDPIRIRFDFGDGTVSAFSALVISGGSVSMSHTYAAEGNYSVRAQTRDLHGALSAYSAGHPIEISDATARYGDVDDDNGGGPVPVLFVNGTAGDATTREMTADNDADVVVHLNAAPAGPANPKFAIWGWRTRPTSSTDRLMPFNVGRMCMDPVLSSCGATACPVYAANTIGKCAQVLCSTPEATGTGAGTTILLIPAGTLRSGTLLTFQGVVKDLSDVDSVLQYSVTNAVIVRMTE